MKDYREKGRDESGYRAIHLMISRYDRVIELQIRSMVQHYWAESIERTSVIYGYHLKELEGDASIISYFKRLSDIFYEIEAGREPDAAHKIELDKLRIDSETIIKNSDKNRVFSSFVNEDIIKTLTEKEKNNRGILNNWIIVFDWNLGSFISWDIVSRNPDDAIKAYVNSERTFPACDGFEVVMIGSSDIKTVRQTHSHYFGIESYDDILENLDQSVIGFSKRMDIDIGPRQILLCLYRKHYWGQKSIAIDTLKNHFCQDVVTFDSSLNILVQKELVIRKSPQSPVSLNRKMTSVISQYL